MATTTPLEGIQDTFRRWGVPFRDGAIVPGRPFTFAPVGVMLHHDAVKGPAGASHKVARVGRKDVPGPLYQFVVRRDLVVDVVSLGRANHAGEGGPWGAIGKDVGNRVSVGVCLENAGDGSEPYVGGQVSLAALATAAILDHLDLGTTMAVRRGVCGHREYTDRKIDPRDVDMGGFRTTVNGFLWAGPPQTETSEGDDMPTPEQLRRLLETTQVGLGPVNARLLGQPDGDISLDGLLVALAGHTAAQTKALADVGAKLDTVIKLLTPPAITITGLPGGGTTLPGGGV